MNSIEKLTKLQNAVGYKQGVVNPIAILGLFGEAGEVMNETLIVGDDLQTEYIKNDGVSAAKLVDAQKKKIRDGAGVSVNVIIPETNLTAFDIEVADALYYLNAIAIGRGKTLADYAEISYQKVSKKTQINIEHTNIQVETPNNGGLFQRIRDERDLYYAWQANIAMAFKDEFHRKAGAPGEMVHVNSDELHDIANQAAKNFIDLLIKE